MSTVAVRLEHREDLLEAYAAHCEAVGLSRESCADRIAAATTFLAVDHDLAAWLRRPLPLRLADLKRFPLAWPLVGFALLTGRARADFDLLAAKHAGRSFAPAAASIYPRELADLHAAAVRLGWAPSWTADVLDGGLPLAIAATGASPTLLNQDDIAKVRDAVRTSPYYSPAVRHSRLSQLHSLARLLYEAGVLPAPPIHRRGDGSGNLESRLAVVGAPQVRRVMLAYLRAKQAVLKAYSIRNLTSHLAAFGEFLTRDYPTLTSVSLLRREHIEAYCAYVPTRRWRATPGRAGCGRSWKKCCSTSCTRCRAAPTWPGLWSTPRSS
jgi:hypothetical protein